MKNQFLSKANNIFLAVGVATFTIMINMALLNLLIPEWHMTIGSKNVPWQMAVRGITLAPLIEELVFRFIPISIALKFDWFKTDEKTQLFVIAMLASVFGYMHGNTYNIAIQGVAGFAFGWVYIKNGMSYWSAVAAHVFYNFLIYFVFPVII